MIVYILALYRKSTYVFQGFFYLVENIAILGVKIWKKMTFSYLANSGIL